MQAGEANFLAFVKSSEQFVIPIYQRTYSWTLKECKQLWEDILKAGEDDKISAHFIGSIVYVSKGIYQVTSIKPLLVIDGQQRLTTLMLLFSALRDYLKKKNIETNFTADKINGYYLMNEKEDNEDRYKLILTKSDKNTLFKIVEGKELDSDDSIRIKENYEYFRSQIANIDINSVYKGISKLIIIDVSLDRERDNPQLIFESLNSTGLELTQADLIRNYILMGLEKREQERLYNDYWYPMEKNFGYAEYSSLFDRFMRDYLTIKTGKIPNINEVYSSFKQHSHNFEKIQELVADICKLSSYFVNIALDKEDNAEIKSAFSEINTLKVDVSYPFLLQIYNDYKEQIITKEELLTILEMVESYVFRRAICGIPTNSLNKTFATLYSKIKKENYLESIQANFLLMDSYRRFPRDKEFSEQFVIKDVYNFRNRNYLLRKLENHNRKETVNVETYTIEHIMPQKEELTPEWQSELGDDWKTIHETYLHTIGNLTLTGYNSELSYKSFIEKRDMEGGFKDSPIRLNASLAKLETWNEKTIVNRATELAIKAVTIWKFPELKEEILYQYKEAEIREDKEYTLSDHPYLAEEEQMRPVFDELRKRILNIDSSVKEEIKKQYIAYKTATNFVDIVPQKKRLRLTLNLRFNEINDPKNICKDVSGIGRWGNGDVEAGISSLAEMDYIMFLIKQSYNKVAEEED